MVSTHHSSNHFILYVLIVAIPAFLLLSCAAQRQKKVEFTASQYTFFYGDETYRIRSISSLDKKTSYNELVGKQFMAADYDQDKVIDAILMGNASLVDAQKIYDAGLKNVLQENKLKIRVPNVNRYIYETDNYWLELITFQPAKEQAFNEFKISKKQWTEVREMAVIIDYNADGKLDEVLKGDVKAAEVQFQYDEAISMGLQKGKLIQKNGSYVVKKK